MIVCEKFYSLHPDVIERPLTPQPMAAQLFVLLSQPASNPIIQKAIRHGNQFSLIKLTVILNPATKNRIHYLGALPNLEVNQ